MYNRPIWTPSSLSGSVNQIVRAASISFTNPVKLDGVCKVWSEVVLANHLIHRSAQGGWGQINQSLIWLFTISSVVILNSGTLADGPATHVPRLTMTEITLKHSGRYTNPYSELDAAAELTTPSGKRSIPLFWDGGETWKLRISPNEIGRWTWKITGRDPGLSASSGSFDVTDSKHHGGIRPMRGRPYHFEQEDGTPFWFFGDTAWSLFTDSADERLDRAAAQQHIDRRESQGFNVVHVQLIAESGWGNSGGSPFFDMSAEQFNPKYWQEVDARLAYANAHGITVGLALAWGDKGRSDPQLWRTFKTHEARLRYARYVAARYSALNVYFIVAGEWHADVSSTPGATEQQVRDAYIEIGNELRKNDPHGRVIAIHPMTRAGSTREFVGTPWMSFGDYQQNYEHLHERILQSRQSDRPVINSEYAYFLRDRDSDGRVDKENSATLDSIRHATWDIVMAGGYFLTGFGTTYYGGNRHPGPFRTDAPENQPWEQQVQHVRKLFVSLPWWQFAPHDKLLTSSEPHTSDQQMAGVIAPPRRTYWALADSTRQYVVYARGCQRELNLKLAEVAAGKTYQIERFDPRSGAVIQLERKRIAGDSIPLVPPDQQDWVWIVTEQASN